MIIDSHTHVDEARGLGWIDPPATIIRLMDEARIDKAAIMTYVDACDEEAIDYIVAAVAEYPDRLVGYARIDPTGDRAAELLEKAVIGHGFKGLKLHPVSNLSHPGSQPTHELIRLAAQLDVPVLFHCGDESYSTPFELEYSAAAVPEAVIIFAHMGGYFHTRDAIEVALRRPNVYLETSAMPRPAVIRHAIDMLGAERIVFASDGPGCDPRLEVYKVQRAGLSSREAELVFSGNIQRLWAGE